MEGSAGMGNLSDSEEEDENCKVHAEFALNITSYNMSNLYLINKT
jgi:hypothetical protein